jgi:protocatechuate 3,4-dioxygenase beta subunit
MTTAFLALLLGLMSAQVPAAAPAQTGSGRISGRVTADDSTTPIAGARVVLFPQRPQIGTITRPGETVTDQDGRFAFERIAAGSYNLDVQKTGYVAFPDSIGRPHTIQVEAGQNVSDVTVQLQKGAIIAGRVLDAAGQPLADVGVMALRRTTLGSQERYLPRSGPGQTNDIGEFRVAGLAPGDYIVAATPRGWPSPFGGPGAMPPAATASRTTPVTTYYPGTRDQATAQTIHVAAAQTIDNVVFGMLSAPAYRISGVVVDDAGTPVSGAMVMVMTDSRTGPPMGPSGNARSLEDGTFVVMTVPTGTYRLIATVPITIASGGRGGASITTWSSGAGGGIVGGVSGGIVGGTTVIARGGATASESMPQPVDVVVADADVSGVRVVVKR